MRAQIVRRVPLVYTTQASPSLDRAPHVRAASGVCWLDDELAIIQDDTSFIALVDPTTLTVRSMALPATDDGLRQFDKSRKNKSRKRDYEACFSVTLAGVPHVFAFGSGSSPEREFVLRMQRLSSGYAVEQIHAPGFYSALRANTDFAGSELNLEGAALRGPKLVLFQRGNGEARAGLLPKNASAELTFTDFVNYLDDTSKPPPTLTNVREHDLGSIDGVRYTFTDATPFDRETLLFAASAEASPNAIDDGEVRGSALGLMDAQGKCEIGILVDEAGLPCRDKVEGIVRDLNDPSSVWLVIDPDDHEMPASLLRVRLGDERL